MKRRCRHPRPLIVAGKYLDGLYLARFWCERCGAICKWHRYDTRRVWRLPERETTRPGRGEP